METILRRTVFNTRPRDFYDVYILLVTQPYDKQLFKNAMEETAKHRGTTAQMLDAGETLAVIENNSGLMEMWDKYRRQFSYARDITYKMILDELKKLLLG